jgi:hypothetical protein
LNVWSRNVVLPLIIDIVLAIWIWFSGAETLGAETLNWENSDVSRAGKS